MRRYDSNKKVVALLCNQFTATSVLWLNKCILIYLTGAAQCGPGMKKVTLDDDYFIINSSDIKFDGDTFKGQRKSNVSFYISGKLIFY